MSTQDNANNNKQLLLPGRLGDPQRDWRSDPRVDPFMIAAKESTIQGQVAIISFYPLREW